MSEDDVAVIMHTAPINATPTSTQDGESANESAESSRGSGDIERELQDARAALAEAKDELEDARAAEEEARGPHDDALERFGRREDELWRDAIDAENRRKNFERTGEHPTTGESISPDTDEYYEILNELRAEEDRLEKIAWEHSFSLGSNPEHDAYHDARSKVRDLEIEVEELKDQIGALEKARTLEKVRATRRLVRNRKPPEKAEVAFIGKRYLPLAVTATALLGLLVGWTWLLNLDPKTPTPIPGPRPSVSVPAVGGGTPVDNDVEPPINSSTDPGGEIAVSPGAAEPDTYVPPAVVPGLDTAGAPAPVPTQEPKIETEGQRLPTPGPGPAHSPEQAAGRMRESGQPSLPHAGPFTTREPTVGAAPEGGTGNTWMPDSAIPGVAIPEGNIPGIGTDSTTDGYPQLPGSGTGNAATQPRAGAGEYLPPVQRSIPDDSIRGEVSPGSVFTK
ncbi:hypothetical protein ACFXNW_29745 [Nocardia sp. NPDC059180]|uniref:hypothetical protein n=1 Tax=Nocardia sp. NPDC059180 TaxID=3346761 RepID=UPI0036AAFD8E